MNFKVAIIDSGVDKNHTRLKACRVEGVTIAYVQNQYSYHPGEYNDASGHGTAIAAIIHRITPDAGLVAVKLAGAGNRITENLLLEGINWCLAQPDIRVINISLGVAGRNPDPKLYEVCKSAHQRGVLIVAAAYNQPGVTCYPAAFPFVYGVSTGLVAEKLDYGYLGEGCTNVLAKGTTQRVAWKDNSFRITSGNSYATAHFTGIVSKLVQHNPRSTADELRKLLIKQAKPGVQELQYVHHTESTAVQPGEASKNLDRLGKKLFTNPCPDFAGNVALFPASEKEINTLIEFSGQCNVTIAACIDFPKKLSLQQEKRLLPVPVLQRQPTDEEFAAIDTLVIGYFLDQLFDANILFGYELIDRSLSLHKNLITWDVHVYKLVKKKIKELKHPYRGRVYFPKVDKGTLTKVSCFRHLPKISVPVVAVIGTSNKQGKITTQLRLKQILTREGYRVSHLSTEPQGLLLGADAVFPYGHKSNVYLDEKAWSYFLPTFLRGIQQFNQPHLILAGTQGWTIPRAILAGEVAGNVLSSMHFLTGIQPDAVICAINPQDPEELIRNTLEAVRIFCEAKVLFCVMTPWLRRFKEGGVNKAIANYSYLNPDELRERMQAYQDRLGIPIIDVMDQNNDSFILETLQNAFSGAG